MNPGKAIGRFIDKLISRESILRERKIDIHRKCLWQIKKRFVDKNDTVDAP